jgi:hypothetical protein
MNQLEMGVSKSVSEPDDYRSCPPPVSVVDSVVLPNRATQGFSGKHRRACTTTSMDVYQVSRPLISVQVPDSNDPEIMMETPTDTSDQIVHAIVP